MPQKKQNIANEPASNDAFDELEQLRLIVFGQARAELDTKIDSLEQSLTLQMNNMAEQFTTQIKALNESMSSQFTASIASLQTLDNTREADKIAFEAANASLASQLEMAENASKDDYELINKRIEKEVNKLELTVDTSMQDILAQIERVTGELSSSKTDRKTLAQLLADMASNLNADS